MCGAAVPEGFKCGEAVLVVSGYSVSGEGVCRLLVPFFFSL